jgi:hypothetical protein
MAFVKALVAVMAALSMLLVSGTSMATTSHHRELTMTVRDCSYPYGGHGPRNDTWANIGNLSVRNLSCTSALTAIHNGYLYEAARGFHTSGFSCYVVRSGMIGPNGQGGQYLGQPRVPRGWIVSSQETRCVSGSKGFRFTWGI